MCASEARHGLTWAAMALSIVRWRIVVLVLVIVDVAALDVNWLRNAVEFRFNV